MNYQIAVTLDGTSGFAGGTISTDIAGSILEIRDANMINRSWNRTAVENSWKDTTRVTG